MSRLQVRLDMAASPEAVWDGIKDISTHTEWMRDAEAIRFTSASTSGVGTTFDCDTKVGPLRLTDRMEVTAWDPPRTMGIRHVGIVTGEGRFELEPIATGTRFVWTEELRFPWWRGGRLAASLAGRVLRRIWKANLSRLRDLVEA